MGYRDLLLTVDDAAGNDARVAFALGLAGSWGAHLTAAAFVADPVLPAAVGVEIPTSFRTPFGRNLSPLYGR